jgi:hypothetical protein
MFTNKFVVFLFIFCVMGLQGLIAQQLIVATGAQAEGASGSVSYSVGQVFFKVVDHEQARITEGIQQPMEIYVVTSVDGLPNVQLAITAYPNPVADMLTLTFHEYRDESMSYRLLDGTGRLLTKSTLAGISTGIPMHAMPPAVYFLQVFLEHKIVKTFKIIKH